MDTYFSSNADQPFIMFSNTHIITLALLFLINMALVIWFRKTDSTRALKGFGYSLAVLILLTKLSFVVWCVWSGVWSLDYSLPLHLCDAAAFLAIIMLVKGSYFFFEIVYFWGLGGGLQALLTPDLAYPFPHYVFFNFFLSHGAVLTAILYMIVVKKFKPTLKSIFKTFIFTNMYMAFIAVANVVTGGNYVFLCHKPESGSIIDFLGPWPWYILSLQGVGLVICFICYIPFMFRNKAIKISH